MPSPFFATTSLFWAAPNFGIIKIAKKIAKKIRVTFFICSFESNICKANSVCIEYTR